MIMLDGFLIAGATSAGGIVAAAITWWSKKGDQKISRDQQLWKQSQDLRDSMMQEIGRLKAKDDQQEAQIQILEATVKDESKEKHDFKTKYFALQLELEAARRALQEAEKLMAELKAENEQLRATQNA